MPMLLPSPNPRLRPFSISCTSGNSRRTSAWLPSLDPLSTTITRQAYVCSRSETRHSRRTAPPFQLMTMTVTVGVGNLLEDVALRCRRGQTAVRVGQALDLGDIGVVLALPPVGARPLAFPVLGIDERPLVFERVAVVRQADALDDAELIADGQPIVDDVFVDGQAPGVDDERVAFPVSDGFAVERADDLVGRRVFAAVEIDDAELVFEPADHVDRRRQLDHCDRPHARHDDGHAGGIALPDPVAIVLAFFLGRFALDERLRGFALELRIRRARAPRVEALAQVDEPGAREIERRLRARLLEIRPPQRARLPPR